MGVVHESGPQPSDLHCGIFDLYTLQTENIMENNEKKNATHDFVFKVLNNSVSKFGSSKMVV